MKEIGPEHPLTFRSEAIGWLLERIRARESCVLVSAPQMGMTRLLDFVIRSDVQQHYLADLFPMMLLLRVDSNRLENPDRWGLCELLLTVIKEGCHSHPQAAGLFPELSQLHKEVLITNNGLLAHRYLEMAMSMLVIESNIDVFFLVNEFDELYCTLAELELSNLRAIRDTYKYRVNFGLCLRDFPDRIRKDSKDRLTDLASRNMLTLGPYSETDAETMIRQLETRKNKKLSRKAHRSIIDLSGGHPGLLSAIFDGINDHLPSREILAADQLLNEVSILRACRNLWNGIAEDERIGLEHVAHGQQVASHVSNILEKKYLIRRTGQEVSIFSPLFAGYVLRRLTNEPNRLVILPETFQVKIGAALPIDLSQREYRLVATLYVRKGQIVTKETIRDEVYGGEVVSDEAIANLVRQARNKIEPIKSHPQYIRNAHGKGYLLFDEKEDNSLAPKKDNVHK